MELLVNNKIISLELPVADVYRKIWVPAHGEVKIQVVLLPLTRCLQADPMRVVYRMRGLLGDATEDMVETLDSGKGDAMKLIPIVVNVAQMRMSIMRRCTKWPGYSARAMVY